MPLPPEWAARAGSPADWAETARTADLVDGQAGCFTLGLSLLERVPRPFELASHLLAAIRVVDGSIPRRA